MHQGTPEVRLWAAVVLTLINDCRDELSTSTSIDNIGRVAQKWRGRANEISFRYILDICDVPPSKVQRWITQYEFKSKRAYRRGYWDDEILVGDQAIVGRGQRRAY